MTARGVCLGHHLLDLAHGDFGPFALEINRTR